MGQNACKIKVCNKPLLKGTTSLKSSDGGYAARILSRAHAAAGSAGPTGRLALSPSARRDDHERGTQDQTSFLARQIERGGCVRGGRDGFGVTLLCMESEREDLVVERL
jgi:hypothetical protein